MTITQVDQNDIVRVVTHKTLASNPGVKWTNTYEIRNAQTQPGIFPTLAELAQMAETIRDFERAYTLADVLFDRVVVATWQADTAPYNGDEFIVLTNVETGTRVATGDMLGLENCLMLNRQPLTGRTGRILLRGALTEDDIAAPSGRTSLNSGFLASLEAALEGAGDGNLLQQMALLEFPFELVMAGRNTLGDITVRGIIDITPNDRVVNKKLDNRYFRRSPSTSPTP